MIHQKESSTPPLHQHIYFHPENERTRERETEREREREREAMDTSQDAERNPYLNAMKEMSTLGRSDINFHQCSHSKHTHTHTHSDHGVCAHKDLAVTYKQSLST